MSDDDLAAKLAAAFVTAAGALIDRSSTSMPTAHVRARLAEELRPIILDVPAVADLLGVKVDTVWKWRQRKVTPPEDGTVSGQPWWWEDTLLGWAEATGRTAVR